MEDHGEGLFQGVSTVVEVHVAVKTALKVGDFAAEYTHFIPQISDFVSILEQESIWIDGRQNGV